MRLAIEITRRCNLCCEHCLRGSAQNVNINLGYIDILFNQLEEAGIDYLDLTLTGGEPSLNTEAIYYIINKLETSDISLGVFYIATNGQGNNDINFINSLMKLYRLSNDRELSLVEVSSSLQHQYAGSIAKDNDLIYALNFVRQRNRDVDYSISNYTINEGNATINNIGCKDNPVYELDLDDTTFYMNAIGIIINGCDWSYDSQVNRKDIFVCDVKDFAKVIKDLK